MGKRVIDNNQVLKRFEFTVKEYLKFYDYFNNSKDSDTDKHYVELQTKLMILRKFDYCREDVYMSNIFVAIRELFPDLIERVYALEERFNELNNYSMEVILCDGTSLNLHSAIEDVTYGLYLHADQDKIERLLQTDVNFYMVAVKEYIDILEQIVLDTYSLVKDVLVNVYERKVMNCAPVIFTGDSTSEDHSITNSPYWKNLYGKDVTSSEYLLELSKLSEEELEIYVKGFMFITELGKEEYSVKILEGLVFPPTRSDWGDFSSIHEIVSAEANIGFSNKIRFNEKHDMAYMHLWKNVEGAFLIDQPHRMQDIIALTFVKESNKYGWRIYQIGDPADYFIETGSLVDWLKYVIKEIKKT